MPIKKVKLSANRKEFLKTNYEKFKKDYNTLSKDEKIYFNTVRAGKKRASDVLRVKGRFVSNVVKRDVQKQIKILGGTGEFSTVRLQKFLDEHPAYVTKVYSKSRNFEVSSSNAADLITDSDKYIYIVRNGIKERYSKKQAIYEIYNTENFLFRHYEIAGFSIESSETDEELIFTLPLNRESEFEDLEDEELIDELEEEYGIHIYAIYNGFNLTKTLKNTKDEDEKQRIERNYKHRKLKGKQAEKNYKDAKEKIHKKNRRKK